MLTKDDIEMLINNITYCSCEVATIQSSLMKNDWRFKRTVEIQNSLVNMYNFLNQNNKSEDLNNGKV